MSKGFVIADPHYLQGSMCTFAGKDGAALRPWGRLLADGEEMSAEEKGERALAMTEDMIDRWNRVVPAQGAKVYVLGDVVMKAKDLHVLGRLNGKKKLVKGNHDTARLKDYAPYFYDIAAYRIKDGVIMSHIPIHEESLKERWSANVHGHLHDGRVKETVYHDRQEAGQSGYWTEERIHPRYLCVSVEHTDYAPITIEEMHHRIAVQQGRA